jgi:hypothetical protein
MKTIILSPELLHNHGCLLARGEYELERLHNC